MVSLRIPTVLGSPLSFASCQTNLVYDGVVGLHGHVEGVALADVGRGICSDRDLKTAFPNHANLKKKFSLLLPDMKDTFKREIL